MAFSSQIQFEKFGTVLGKNLGFLGSGKARDRNIWNCIRTDARIREERD